jgi:hypothetical protein
MPVYLQANLFSDLTELGKGKRGDTLSNLAESFYGWVQRSMTLSSVTRKKLDGF